MKEWLMALSAWGVSVTRWPWNWPGHGAELLVIDRDEEKVGEIREITENAIVLKTLDKKALMETGIQNCDVAVVCIGEHMDTSILTTLYLVGMGIPTVISKADQPGARGDSGEAGS